MTELEKDYLKLVKDNKDLEDRLGYIKTGLSSIILHPELVEVICNDTDIHELFWQMAKVSDPVGAAEVEQEVRNSEANNDNK